MTIGRTLERPAAPAKSRQPAPLTIFCEPASLRIGYNSQVRGTLFQRVWTMKTHVLAVLGVAAVTIAVSTSAFAAPSCLELGRIWNWKVIDNKTLIVEDDTHQKFKMSLMGYCPDLPFKERIAFKSVGGSELSCLGTGDYVLAHDVAIPERCPITSVVPYTPDMEAADKAAAKAQQTSQGAK